MNIGKKFRFMSTKISRPTEVGIFTEKTCRTTIQMFLHNQGNAQWSPDPFSCERVGSGPKTTDCGGRLFPAAHVTDGRNYAWSLTDAISLSYTNNAYTQQSFSS